ncbi:flagellar biosynthesis anti-sigma factor FlgM [Clostridium chauvoei]|uniref:Negative regulator of flagellin synthesis n=2 Tax=Clostridium chauvoei TaxID=46867 RepID=S6F883_9CLOT|nr:flagellar biosynthesis anti-sigma factor FlgM [Clostridium chauvoei]ATD54614.1 flagellar biosynthesis anti-sigma factor FlgM [Clostridium chauvoei]ATD57705.1 flagellar biosynthesis anti-sigma factor FlgM [Clostridium chauvoei]MBX7281026.1 flagellar biosynthesis anti-sigma factor FlgM [Clostridium chauvoei]MBX7283473.1 flagellar biosynthesis anti-sigma factor FlgM [Clostridium chauvoei]MBX7286115.1 flagellar biosynthesis anti-sigma factor FlgM [Clostridium chauvoei]
MNIKGIGLTSGINYYNKVSNSKVNKIENKVSKDRIEISKEAKALRDYGIDRSDYDKSAKVNEIKNKLSNGTYKIDAKLTAKAMIDEMRRK